MSTHPLGGPSSTTELTVYPLEDPSKWQPTVFNGGESMITSSPSTPTMVNADQPNDGEPYTTHQDKKETATSLAIKENIVKPVTMMSATEQQPGSVPMSNTGNDAAPLSDDLSTSDGYLEHLRRKGHHIPVDPPIVLLMQILLQNPQQMWRDIIFQLFCGEAKQPIHVIDDGDTKYYLWLSMEVFTHDSFNEFACNLWINDFKERFKSRDRFQLGKPDIFIPLGWLVQSEGRAECTTRYVVLWNTSTEPHSLWLAYDYYASDDAEDCDSIDELDDLSYCNGSHHNNDSLRFGAELEQPSDQSLDKAKMPAQSQDQWTRVDERNAKFAHGHTDALPGFLGAEKRFDLGMIIRDANEWDPNMGTSIGRARLSLSSTSKEYGKALKATNLPEST